MKISVIVPIYNQENFILQALECLQNQTYQNLEFILVNDGSTDATGSIIQAVVGDDPRFMVINQNNHGYGYSCNRAMEKVSGDYVAIYEPDDIISDDFYGLLANKAQYFPEADILRYNGFYTVDSEEKQHKLYTWKELYTNKVIRKDTNKRFWRSHPSVFNGIYKTSFLKKNAIKFCEGAGASFQDAQYMISLYYANPNIFILNDSKYFYRLHENQSIRNVLSKLDFVFENWEQQYNFLSSHKEKSFFVYRTAIQAWSLLEQTQRDDKIFQHLSLIFNQPFRLSEIATFKEKYKICHLYLRWRMKKNETL